MQPKQELRRSCTAKARGRPAPHARARGGGRKGERRQGNEGKGEERRKGRKIPNRRSTQTPSSSGMVHLWVAATQRKRLFNYHKLTHTITSTTGSPDATKDGGRSFDCTWRAYTSASTIASHRKRDCICRACKEQWGCSWRSARVAGTQRSA